MKKLLMLLLALLCTGALATTVTACKSGGETKPDTTDDEGSGADDGEGGEGGEDGDDDSGDGE
jgi:hypothetical protein